MSAFPPLTEVPTPGYWAHDLSPFLVRFPAGWPVDGIRWYGLAYVTGFLVAAWLLRVYFRKGRSPLNDDMQATLMTAGILGTVVGGRLGYVLGYMLVRDPGALAKDPWVIFKVNQGGMSSHGGMIGIALAVAWCARRFKVSFLRLADIVVTLGPPGILFGRIANFINGELWGRETDVPWAVVFRFPDVREAVWLTPRHPSQLYAAALEGALLLLWTQWRFWKKEPLPEGQVAGECLIGYALVRIVGEFWREPDAGVSLVLGLSRGQFYSVFLAVAGVLVVWWARRAAAAKAA